MTTKKKATPKKNEWMKDKKRYVIINAYPGQTIDKWISDYYVFYGHYILAKQNKDSHDVKILREVLTDIKKFLKEKTNIKFA